MTTQQIQPEPVQFPTLPTAYDILTATYAPIKWTLPGLLPPGLATLGGRPKQGKSVIALQFAKAVASGGWLFDTRVNQGAVLMINLEDSKERLQDRMQKQGWDEATARNVDILTNTDFLKYIGKLHKGGFERLAAMIEHRGYSLVVIDTWSRAFAGVRDADNNQEVTAALSPFQTTALDLGAAILILDHTSKMSRSFDPDPVFDLMGSTAKVAIADTVMGFYAGKKGGTTRRLVIRGRDVESQDTNLTYEVETMTYEIDPDDTSTLPADERKAIAFLRDAGSGTFTQILNATGANKGNLSTGLRRLVSDGWLSYDTENKKYAVIER